jgi:hypothetical protein
MKYSEKLAGENLGGYYSFMLASSIIHLRNTKASIKSGLGGDIVSAEKSFKYWRNINKQYAKEQRK